MKGIRGLIIAIGLGIAGALCNWSYLASRVNQEQTVGFVGIKQGKTINRGEIFRDEDLVEIKIPLRWVGDLKEVAVLADAGGRETVPGQRAWRTMTGERILLREDLTTPPEESRELNLEEGETAMWVPVDTRTFVPSLLKPGDRVTFKVAKPSGPTPAGRGAAPGPFEDIGPFTILALGNRLGRADLMRSAKMPLYQENVLMIRVSSHVPDEKKNADHLLELLQATNFRMVGVVLHSRKDEKQ